VTAGKLQNRREIANTLMSAFGVTTHEEQHMDEETGRSTIQVLRVNVMNPPRDTDEQEVREELHRTGIVNYNNLTVYYDHYTPDDVVQINFLVNSEMELKRCTTAVVNIYLHGRWCRLEESLSNYNQITSAVFSNLPKRILGPDIDRYIKSHIDAAYINCVNTIADYKKQKETIQIPNFNPPPCINLQQMEKILYRQNKDGYTGEVVIQFRDSYVAKWLATMYEHEVLTPQDSRQLITTRYPEHPYVIIDRLKEFWISMFFNNYKYSKTTNINIQTERQEPREFHSNKSFIQGIKTYTYHIKHTIQISKRYRKKLRHITIYDLLKMTIGTCLQAITKQTYRIMVTISICSHSIGFFLNKHLLAIRHHLLDDVNILLITS
jgi:hypothetical protein